MSNRDFARADNSGGADSRFPLISTLGAISVPLAACFLVDPITSVEFGDSFAPEVEITSVDGFSLESRAKVLALSASAIEIWTGDPFLTLRKNIKSRWRLRLLLPKATTIDLEILPLGCKDGDGVRTYHLRVASKSLKRYQTELLKSLLLCGRIESLSDATRLKVSRGNISAAVEFRVIRSKEEFEKVVWMRTRAYQKANKHESANNMTDEFDERSVVLAAFVGSKPVASLRLMPHGIGEEWEHDRFVQWPTDFPPKNQCVEITRVCVDPDFQRATHLLMGLFTRAAAIVGGVGRPHLIGCATDKLLPLYRKIGCQISSHSFTHSDLGNLKHTLFLADVRREAHGVGIGLATWVVLWRHCASWMIFHDVVGRGSPMLRLRYRVNRALAPLISVVIRIALSKGQKQ